MKEKKMDERTRQIMINAIKTQIAYLELSIAVINNDTSGDMSIISELANYAGQMQVKYDALDRMLHADEAGVLL